MGGMFGRPGVQGFSPNANENAQRLALANARASTPAMLDQLGLGNYFLTGQFDPITTKSGGKTFQGNIQEQPTGGLAGLTGQGIQDEFGNSAMRQQIAMQQLGLIPGNLAANQAFGGQSIADAMQAMQMQGGLRNLNALGTFGGNLGLNQDITQDLSNFFASGGAASDAQAGNIGDVFDAQRQIAASNLGQQFDERMRQATDSFSNRGLRNTDTPAQELLGRSIDEFGRQAANTEAALGSQQSQALLQQPFLQAQLGGQLQGQSQNNLLNILSSYSQPISQGGFGANLFNNANQFGLQFSPSSVQGPTIQNALSLLGGANPAPSQPVFTGGVRQSPNFMQTLGQSTAQSLGSAVGQGVAGGIGYGLGGPAAVGPAMRGN
jgi:hypothetical protein